MATPAKRAAPPIPPDKGSFPLDHFGQCTQPKAAYLQCIKRQQAAALEPSGKPKTVDTAVCKPLIKLYLQCRMDNGLMAKEDLSRLGLGDVPEATAVSGTAEQNK